MSVGQSVGKVADRALVCSHKMSHVCEANKYLNYLIISTYAMYMNSARPIFMREKTKRGKTH